MGGGGSGGDGGLLAARVAVVEGSAAETLTLEQRVEMLEAQLTELGDALVIFKEVFGC